MFSGFYHVKARYVTTQLLDAAERGELSWEKLARDALGWMSESEVEEFAQANDLMRDEDEDEDEDEDCLEPDNEMDNPKIFRIMT